MIFDLNVTFLELQAIANCNCNLYNLCIVLAGFSALDQMIFFADIRKQDILPQKEGYHMRFIIFHKKELLDFYATVYNLVFV